MSATAVKPRPQPAAPENDTHNLELALPDPKARRNGDQEPDETVLMEQQLKAEQMRLEEAKDEEPFSFIQRLVLPDDKPSSSSRKQKPAPTTPKESTADDLGSLADDTKLPPVPSDLSELAQQLRLLQSKGAAQALEIQRLERQLQVVADLQNVSVSDVREALRAACAAQAAPELRATLADLRNQLQAAQLQLALRAAPTQGPRRSEVADLQLRIGELEELEQEKNKEIQVLYKDLKEQSSSWIRLKAKYEEQELLLEEYRRRERQQESLKRAEDTSNSREADASADKNDDGMCEEEERLKSSEQTLREELELANDFSGLFRASGQGAITTENVEQKVEESQLLIMQQQLEEAEKTYRLKQAQLKARNCVLEEYVQDLEQQLSSLYTAFNMTNQDLDQEQQVRRALELNLNEADQRVAQYIDTASKNETVASSTRPATSTFPVSPYPPEQAPPRVATAMYPYPPMMTNVATDESPTRRFSSPAHTASPSLRGSFSPSRSIRSMPSGECVLEGILLLRTAGLRRKLWKERHAALYLSSSQFYLVLSNLGDHSNAKTYVSPVGSSELRLYHKQPLAFTLLVSPGESFATVLYLAAIDETDFENWMNALGAVSTRSEREREIEPSYSQRATTSNYNDDMDDREAAELERALWLSTQEQVGSNGLT